MVSFTEGTVVAILPKGFRIETEAGETDCHTVSRGEALTLAVGDQVRVYGDPHPRGGFATTTIHRKTADGRSEEIPCKPKASWIVRALSAIMPSRTP